ncbi:putative CDP-diacylglycerol--inositol 3-phosphatidyltransferase, Long-chain-fatty-acid--CoA ligase [Rosa chinensis]|uniref:Putative CDP-diacylglycerol--inositol 3-phosphatidyltransferase, Long-chain-fatty-acid--CoA ligase n=1 Tax=Rosa chinensis TaxID=74649 RepID=A0A2P6PNA9_ROSCH|nr:putative CDP-diacylglycerol--inositol 3-phosphatidyltransferase, Long-chain-fatty-acid--CoA ligase [Rosa chinensis]
MTGGFNNQKLRSQSCANAVDFIINHAEVSIAFVQENKLPAHSKAEELGVSCFSWEEFFQLVIS